MPLSCVIVELIFCSKICVYKCTNSAILIVILLLYLQSSRRQPEMTAVYSRSMLQKGKHEGLAEKILIITCEQQRH